MTQSVYRAETGKIWPRSTVFIRNLFQYLSVWLNRGDANQVATVRSICFSHPVMFTLKLLKSRGVLTLHKGSDSDTVNSVEYRYFQ